MLNKNNNLKNSEMINTGTTSPPTSQISSRRDKRCRKLEEKAKFQHRRKSINLR